MARCQGCQKLTEGVYTNTYNSNTILICTQGDRFVGALSVIKARAPVTGGNFGVWGGMFSTFDCAVKGWRQKEDMWNAIISGFMTGGCLAARSTWLHTLHPRFMVSTHCLLQAVLGQRWAQQLLAVFFSVYSRASASWSHEYSTTIHDHSSHHVRILLVCSMTQLITSLSVPDAQPA